MTNTTRLKRKFDVIPGDDNTPVRSGAGPETEGGSTFSQYFLAASVLLGVTLLSFLLTPVVGHRAIGLVYLVAVIALAMFVGRGATLFAATVSAVFWDFFFLAPITDLHITDAQDAMMFGTYFLVAVALGQLTFRMRVQVKSKREGEEWATAMYQLTRGLTEAAGLDQLVQTAVQELERAFDAQIAVLLPDSSRRLSFQAHPASTYEITGPEQPVAEWAFEHGKPAGKYSHHLTGVDALFLPLVTDSGTMGVAGLNFKESSPPTPRARSLLDAFLQQIALAINRHHTREVTERSKRLAESERLSKALLNSVSHEIRTPIAAIKNAASNLLDCKEGGLSGFQQAMIAEIQEATERLNHVVGNVLDITRIESGHVRPKVDLCDVADLVNLAVSESKKNLTRHKLEVEIAPGLPLVPLDFVLTQQALMNLLANAAFHTPPGTTVQVSARVRDGMLALVVADRGPGLPAESIPRLFDKFYRLPNAPVGGTGLGLSVVKGFIESQGGQVRAENRFGGGATFTVRLPLNRTPSGGAAPSS